jgi:hypothetical protein
MGPGLKGPNGSFLPVGVVYPGAASESTADVGDWTVPTPRPPDAGVVGGLTSFANQTGSRIYYIDPSQTVVTTELALDQAADYYFFDGTDIIDSAGSPTGAGGVAYGTDPMNPTGPIKPYKRYAYVCHRRDGQNIGTYNRLQLASITPGVNLGRHNRPDWFLFKRGTTLDIVDDFVSFNLEGDATSTPANSFGALSRPGCSDTTYPQVTGAYGDLSTARPRFIHPLSSGFFGRNQTGSTHLHRNVKYLSLHLDGSVRGSTSTAGRAITNSSYGSSLLNATVDETGVLWEDCFFDRTQGMAMNFSGATIKQNGEQTFRRCILADAYNTTSSGPAGFYCYGTELHRIRFEDCLCFRNGFNDGEDYTTLSWPPASTSWDAFSRNFYQSGTCNHNESWFRNNVSIVGASGDQFRNAPILEGNFFLQGYLATGAHGGDDQVPTGYVRDNVHQVYYAAGGAHPGWGFEIRGGIFRAPVMHNIVTDGGVSGTYTLNGMQLAGISTAAQEIQYRTTAENLLCNNVICFTSGSHTGAAMNIRDGLGGGGTTSSTSTSATYNPIDAYTGVTYTGTVWNYPALGVNYWKHNTVIGTFTGGTTRYDPYPGGTGGSDQSIYTETQTFATLAAANAALGTTTTARNLKTYLQARGVTVTSADGVPEYCSVARTLKRGTWRYDWTAKAIVNYFREGFNMPALV